MALEWVSIAEAARRLDKSDRTIKRRIEAGEIQSKLENLPGGGVRRLVQLGEENEPEAAPEPAEIARDVPSSERDTRGPEEEAARDVRDNRQEHAGQETHDARASDEERAGRESHSARDERDTARDTRGPGIDPTERLIASLESQLEEMKRDKDAQIEDLKQQREAWRAQTEDARREAAQANARLREISRAMPRQLEAGNPTPASEAAAPNETVSETVSETDAAPQIVVQPDETPAAGHVEAYAPTNTEQGRGEADDIAPPEELPAQEAQKKRGLFSWFGRRK